MKISVVIPAYNCSETIEMVLDSVCAQTRFDLIEEIIVINDGSTDDTDRVIRNYREKNKSLPLIYVSQKNHGVSYTRNRAIYMAKGEWIALLDSDDLWKPKKIERQVDILKKNPNIRFLGTVSKMKLIVSKKEGLYKLNAKELCIRNMPQTPSIIFHKKTGIKLGLYNVEMQYGEDINFYQKFLTIDSYYILVEDLIVVGFQKKYFAQKGLSSNLYKMHMGRNKNTRELYKMGLIPGWYLHLMIICNWGKFFKNYVIQKIRRSEENKLSLGRKYRNVVKKLFNTKNRRRLENYDFSLLCNNCVGGVISHELGVRFNSPTVNLFMEPSEYILFLKDLKKYLNYPLKEINDEKGYPVALIDNIKIYGMHYSSFSELDNLWKKRCKRVNFNNLYIMLIQRDGCSDEIVYEFDKLPFKHKMVIANKEYKDVSSLIYLPELLENGQVRDLCQYQRKLTGKRWIDKIDYVSFLNKRD